jgi:uncharacterized membrane protein
VSIVLNRVGIYYIVEKMWIRFTGNRIQNTLILSKTATQQIPKTAELSHRFISMLFASLFFLWSIPVIRGKALVVLVQFVRHFADHLSQDEAHDFCRFEIFPYDRSHLR